MRTKHKYKATSIRAIYFMLCKKGTKLNPLQIAVIADKVLQTERLAYLQIALEALNLDLIHKNDISPTEYAKAPHIAILGRSYALAKKSVT